MQKSDSNHEDVNQKAQQMLEAALGGEELKADVTISTGSQIHQELLDRAKQRQASQKVPDSIKEVSFAYQRSKLGANVAKRDPVEDAEAKARRAKAMKQRSERLSKLGMKDEKLGGKSQRPDAGPKGK